MNRIKHRLSVLIVAGLLVACGGGDDDSADSEGDDTEQQGDDAPADADADSSDDGDRSDDGDSDATDGDSDATDGDMSDADSDEGDGTTEPAEDDGNGDGDDGDTIVISDFDDIPRECVELMGEFLREIEPVVSQVDWPNATLEDLEAFGEELDVPMADFDRRTEESGCDRFEMGADDEQSLEFAIRVAEREAPDTVGWLQFIAGMSTLGETVDDVMDPNDPDDGSALDVTECDDLRDILIEKAEEYGTLTQAPVSEIMELSTLVSNATTVCTIAELEELYNDPAILAFLEG